MAETGMAPRQPGSGSGSGSGALAALTAPPGRDLRVDFFRGLALATIFINHVPGNLLEHATSRNFGFSDATELFVFLAGYAAALAYFSVPQRKGLLFTWVKAWRRAFDLYAAHVFAVALCVAIIAWASIQFGDGKYLEWIGLADLFHRTPEAVLGVAALSFQPGYFNILPMYIALLLLLPLLLLLRARLGLGALLGFSVALYLAAQLTGFNIPTWPAEGTWFFNPLTWQLVFAIGLAAGWAVREGRVLVGFHPWLYAAAGAYVVLALGMKLAQVYPDDKALALPFFLYGQEKSFVSLPRVLHVLALVYLVAYMPQRFFARLNPRGAFTVMGRNALPVFVTGSVLAILAQVLSEALPTPTPARQIALDLMLVVTGLLFQIGLAKGLQWYRDKSAPAARTAGERKPAPEAARKSAGAESGLSSSKALPSSGRA